MPATPSAQQRYTAGNCVLTVDLQLSALSKWYPQPIAQALQFELWMSASEDAEPVLFAEGDRTTLQALSQSVSQQVQSSLAIAHLSHTARPPAPLAIAQPLSHLQLCDLQSVLYQCQQATRVLPVALDSVEAIALQSTEVNQNPINQASRSNVVSLSAARRRKLWIGSAAAGALLAVGLTTAVWQGNRNSQQIAATVNSDANRSTQNLEESAAVQSNLPAGNAPDTPSEGPTSQESIGSRQQPDSQGSFSNPTATEEPQISRSVEPSRERTNPSDVNSAIVKPPATDSAIAPPATEPASPNNQLPVTPPSPASPPTSADEIPEVASAPAAQQAQEPSLESPESLSTDPPAGLSATVPSAESYPRDSRARDSQIRDSQAQRAPAAPEAIGEAEPGGAIYANAVDQVIAQTQTYFQNRLQIIELSPTSPLVYQIRLSEAGQIISFEPQSEAAEAEASSLQPNELTLDLSAESLATTALVTLRLEVAPNGQVQVTQSP